MSDQLEMFKEYKEKLKGIVGEERTNFILSKSLFLVVAGSDDIANTYFVSHARELEYDVPSYTDLMLDKATTFFKILQVRSSGGFWPLERIQADSNARLPLDRELERVAEKRRSLERRHLPLERNQAESNARCALDRTLERNQAESNARRALDTPLERTSYFDRF
ncbi:hypothetical protein I3843_08G068400 [Carya illinoinensis]|nr:hypothetical protein I3843_08G068400 [Carya illinoinensis]